MANNTTVGVQSISTDGNASGLAIQEVEARVAEGIAGGLIGGTQLSGLLVLLGLGYGLYNTDTSIGVAATVLVPAVLFLGQQGLLPFGQSIIYGVILIAAAIVTSGVIDSISRN